MIIKNRTGAALALSKQFFIFFIFIMMAFDASAGKESPPTTSFDGLELTSSTKNSYVYKKPGVDFKFYTKVALAPVKVRFKKNWKKKFNSSRKGLSGRVTDKDMSRIIKSLSSSFDEIFREELGKAKGFELTSKLSDNVLLIQPALINLDVNAPDLNSVSRVRSYVEYAGEGTLYLELYDGVSGEILARAVDTRKTRDHNYYQWASRSSNRTDARALLSSWAKNLRSKLEEVHNLDK